jgi:thiol peroxidase
MGLLTRAIIIIDTEGNVAYKELVANISQHPDYETALKKLKSISQAVKPAEITTNAHSE